MKYFVMIVFAAVSIACVTGCTKTHQPPTHIDILTGHTWYLKYLFRGDTEANSACNLSEILTLKKDSTGNHFYATTCDPSQPSNIPFRWYIEDNTTVGQYYTSTILTTTLYCNNINNKDSNITLRLVTITKDSLQMKGVVNSGAGFRAVYTSYK